MGKCSAQDIGGGRTDDGLLRLLQQLHALLRGIRSLVELSRQIFYRKHHIGVILRKILFIHQIDRRFRENRHQSLFINLIGYILYIIAVQDTYAGYGFNPQIAADLTKQIFCPHGKFGFLFDINSLYAHVAPAFLPALPVSCII